MYLVTLSVVEGGAWFDYAHHDKLHLSNCPGSCLHESVGFVMLPIF